MIAYQIAIFAPLILLIYLVVIDFVDLYPFNNVRKHTNEVRKFEFINYMVCMLGIWSCYWREWYTSLFIALILLVGNIKFWWIPYFFGCSEKHRANYDEKFSETLKILPPIKDHPIPDVEHFPVTVLTLIWLVAIILNLV